MNIKPDYYHYIALLGFLGLFALLMLWNTVLASASTLPVALKLLLTVSPLLLPLRGFLSRTAKSCAWMAYISLAYFIHGAIETYVNDSGLLYPVLEVSFSLMLFFGCTLYVHYSGKQG
ncbi:MAG: DUF2069 domain-containing protein [Methylococcales bacterium]|nr:DUF2069 domain-containing protein [Methylococcales bacterium]